MNASVANARPCIMPDFPYCPSCKYGLVDCHNDDPAFPEWICLYDPAEDEKKLNICKTVEDMV